MASQSFSLAMWRKGPPLTRKLTGRATAPRSQGRAGSGGLTEGIAKMSRKTFDNANTEMAPAPTEEEKKAAAAVDVLQVQVPCPLALGACAPTRGVARWLQRSAVRARKFLMLTACGARRTPWAPRPVLAPASSTCIVPRAGAPPPKRTPLHTTPELSLHNIVGTRGHDHRH